ncbi:baseplate hub subunit tail length determinator [Serratia phage X20]|uniref:Baseplate hub subunit tail length determinator n=1 Tax=Serratia phage X20 TaxID=2006942 RepID=A0A1Z1LZF8_9CAUD|nr:baseplate hub subunit and tail length [Serratia phage X20]ARW58172.1 baseplate hub subunit tail length determinator [Serratia phage X20]
MKKPSNMSTMRRKQIEDSAPERKAQATADSQVASLNDLNSGIGDLQASSELIADTVENKGNQILGSISELGSGIQEVAAASELAAEASEKTTEETRKLNDVAATISDKLSKLSQMFEQKISGTGTDVPASSQSNESTTLAAIKEAMPLQVEQPSLKELLEKLIPDNHPLPPADPFPEEPQAEDKPSKQKKDGGDGHKLEDLLKVTKSGFKSTIGITDKIAGMLFKFSIATAAEAAKMAGMIFAVILGIDLIKIHFKYWSDLFNKSFEDFFEKAEEWGPLIQSVVEMAGEISNMWSEKNWSGLAMAIIKGIGDITVALADLMFLGITKITSAILRAIGMDDKALTVEGYGLEKFQESGASLDDKDQETLARYQDSQDKERKETYESLPRGLRNMTDEQVDKAKMLSEKTANLIKSRGKSEISMDLPEEERLQIRMVSNEAKAAIKRTEALAAKTKPDDKDRIENLDKSIGSISDSLNDPALANAPEVRKELQEDLSKLTGEVEKIKAPIKVAPAPVEEQEDVQKTKRIEEHQRAISAPTGAGTGAANIVSNTVLNKTNKTSYNMPPQSSTPAPGMGASARVN